MLSHRQLLGGVLLAACALVPASRAADAPASVTEAAAGRWSTRIRATYLETVDHSSGALGKNVLSVSDELIPEFDIDYRINAQWSLELVLSIPQEHTVKLKGAGAIGTFEHLPPTFFAQYHPWAGKVFQPYVGAGVNFTLIFNDELLGGAAKLDNYSVGPAAQAGFDLRLNERWKLNFDLKRIMIRSDVTVGGAEVAKVRLDPWAYSIGLGYDF